MVLNRAPQDLLFFCIFSRMRGNFKRKQTFIRELDAVIQTAGCLAAEWPDDGMWKN